MVSTYTLFDKNGKASIIPAGKKRYRKLDAKNFWKEEKEYSK